MTRAAIYLQLGRVSNLPTVWTNVLAGAALAGGALRPARVALLLGALSLVYIAGMFLNDAFDRRFDAIHRPERPIARGLITPLEVFAVGFALLAAGTAMLAACGPAAWSGLALAAAVVAYDAWHKSNPFSPALMALCRALVYVTAALGTRGQLGLAVVAGAALAFGYILALTAWAQRGRGGVAHWLAGICLVDGGLMLSAGAPLLALAGLAGSVATPRLQRRIPGT